MKTEAEQTIQRKKQIEKRKENKKTSREQQRTKYKGESFLLAGKVGLVIIIMDIYGLLFLIV